MPRYEERGSSNSRLYVGRLSSRTRSRDLEDLFSKYGRVRDVDMKNDFAFVDFSDPRDADDARYNLDGREFSGSRLIVEFAKGAPRGSGGPREFRSSRDSRDSRDFSNRGAPPPGSGRCFNCGLEGHWARDCTAGDWRNKCYRCGERGHIERSCQNSPKSLKRGRSYSRSPSPHRGKGRGRSYSRSPSGSRSPPRRERSIGGEDKHSKSYSRSPKLNDRSPPLSKGRKRSPTPDEKSPQNGGSPKQITRRNGSDYSGSPRVNGKSPVSPREANGHSPSRSHSLSPKANKRSPIQSDDENGVSPRGSE